MTRNRIRCTAFELPADVEPGQAPQPREFDMRSDPTLGRFLMFRFPGLVRQTQLADRTDFQTFGGRLLGLRSEANPPFPETTYFPASDDWSRREGRPDQAP